MAKEDSDDQPKSAESQDQWDQNPPLETVEKGN